MKRRDVIKGLTLLPLAGGVAASSLGSAFAAPGDSRLDLFKELGLNAVEGPLKAGPQVYQSIGVEPLINCRGTFTIIGASVELPEVRKAMEYACQYNVQLDELAMGVGKRLGEITGAEWGMVSAGCAAGIKHVTLACLTGGNPERLIRIPDLTGFDKDEVIIPRNSRSQYDHSIRNTGVKVIMVNNAEELKDAITPRTAMIYMTPNGAGGIEGVVKAAAPFNIPVLVDAAAEALTIPNVHLAKGATIVAYSGGKAIRGPQCAGILLGRKDILMSAWQSSAPHHGAGRDNKIGREEHIGMLAAVEAWVTRDHAAEEKMWLAWMDNIAKRVGGIESVKTTIRQPTGLDNRTAGLTISWDPAKLNITGPEAAAELTANKPRIAINGAAGTARPATATAPTTAATGSLSIAAWQMQPGDDKIVADRIFELLSKKRNPVSTAMKAPSTNIAGRWDVTMEFFSGKGQHKFFIEKQDGNWLNGSHKTEFDLIVLTGTIDGDEVKFRSSHSIPGDTLGYTFSGTVSGDSMSGKVNLGEYLTAKFTAKKYTYPAVRTPIVMPVSPIEKG